LIKFIIFDFDGVIVESVGIKTEAFTKLFENRPEYRDKIVELHLAHGGLSRFVKFEMIYKDILHQPLSEDKKKELGERFTRYVFNEVVECPFVAGAEEFLKKYYQTVDLFIVSGTPQEEIQAIVKKRRLDKYFKEVFGAPRRKAKLAQNILDSYQLNPQEAIFVGDSLEDYEGAREAGIKFVGRSNDEKPFKNLPVELLVSDFFDLEKLINEQKI